MALIDHSIAKFSVKLAYVFQNFAHSVGHIILTVHGVSSHHFLEQEYRILHSVSHYVRNLHCEPQIHKKCHFIFDFDLSLSIFEYLFTIVNRNYLQFTYLMTS